jgi:hypothetical protein
LQIAYRYNRPKAFHAVNLTVTDALLTAAITPTKPDDGFTGVGEVPMIPADPVSLILSLDELKALTEFDDGAMLSFDAMELKPGVAIKWKNLYLGTLLGRRSMLDYLRELGWNTAFRILVPSAGITSMRQCKYIVQMHDAAGVLECVDPIATLATPQDFTALQFRPRIIGPTTAGLTSPSVPLSIQLEDSDGQPIAASGTVFLETTAGTLSRPRVVLGDQGAGTFELFTAGIQPGEKVKIKAGFRYFPGAEDHLVEFAA